MPDPIDRKTSELTSPTIFTDIGNSDYLFVAHYDSANQEYVNWKVSVTELASKILKNIEYTSDLTTTSKVIINAINEIAQGSGNTLANLTDVDITTPAGDQRLVYDSTASKWINKTTETVLTGTLTTGSTTLTLTDNAITTTAMYDFYTDVFGVNPTAVTVSTGSMTLTFEARQSDLNVKVVVR